ncbi:hypothetical protein J0X14_09930 [Muricauda sp. CAU 1633]|uniref:beta strand repeat-containing protein n=1 Tax=Allomuricauda sp. CAU 1633 TaxID=2816036 RepID=UPI001A8C9254|nr:hypothetical protein [Muricauda sp. CAU 1633]MBO0322614.1 hypothetical protein [Muricauda sp. CAU 1633]
MKTQIAFLIVGLLLFTSLKAQVKIGDNPQNLDPASVLELESSNRVLVITRVTTAQMSAINPLPGALIYNTDEDCIHYYNGVEWINICEALDNSFTVSTQAVFNTAPDARDSTVVVTQTETPDGINYNFEVNQITGDNVYNGTLFGSDLAPQTVGVREIQNGSVGLEKLEDGTLTGQLMQWDGINWTLISEADITVTELDGVVGNEVVGPTDTTLVLNGNGTEALPFTLDVALYGIDTEELNTDAVTSAKIANGAIVNEDISHTAAILGTKINSDFGDQDVVTTGALASGNATITGTLTTSGLVTIGANTITNADGTNGQVLTTDGAGNASWQDTSPTAVETTAAINGDGLVGSPLDLADNAVTTQKILDGNVTNAKIANDAITNAKMADDAVNTNEIVDNAITTPKILDGNITNAKVADNAINIDKIGTLGAADANNVLTTNGAGDPQWEDRTNFASSALNDGNIFVGNVANSATGVPMSGDATIDNTGLLTIQNDAVTNAMMADDAVNTDEIVDNAITTPKILDGNITNAKVADNAINIDKIGTLGAADANSVLTTNGIGDPQWENRTNFTSSALNDGDIFVGDATNNAVGVTMGGDATINNLGELTIANDAITNVKMANDAIDTDEIVDDAVTTDKILDANVTTDKIANGDVTPIKIEPSASPTDGDVLTTVGGAVVWQAPAVVAMGKVSADALTVNSNGAGVVRNSAGNYTVTFGAGVTIDADYIVQLTLLNAGPDVTIEVSGTPTATTFTVQISQLSEQDLAGALIATPVDAQWYFTVTDF